MRMEKRIGWEGRWTGGEDRCYDLVQIHLEKEEADKKKNREGESRKEMHERKKGEKKKQGRPY